MIWLIVAGTLIVALLLFLVIVASDLKDELLDILGRLFCASVILVAIGLPIAFGYWLHTQGYQEDVSSALAQMEDAIGFSGGLVIMGSSVGVMGLVLIISDAVEWLKEMQPARVSLE